MRTLIWLLSLSLAPVLACGEPPPPLEVHQQTLEVGCGTCMFKQVGGQGCYWAARVGETVFPMKGTVLPSEQELPSHGPEGMCSMTRQAVVDGTVRDGMLTVTRFELLPPDPSAPRAPAHDHAH